MTTDTAITSNEQEGTKRYREMMDLSYELGRSLINLGNARKLPVVLARIAALAFEWLEEERGMGD